MRIALVALAVASLVVYGEKSKPHGDTYRGNPANTVQQSNDATGRTVIVVNQQTPQGEQDNHPRKPPSYFHELLLPQNVPNIALVFVAGFTLIVLWKQAQEMRLATKAMQQSNKSMMDKERARIVVTLYDEDRPFSFSTMKPIAPLEIYMESFPIQISQDGPSHAFNVIGYGMILITPAKNPPPMRPAFPLNIPTTIKAGSVPLVEYVDIPITKQSEIDDVLEGRQFAHLFGVITYEDVFETVRITPFRYIWTVVEEAMGEGEESQTMDQSWWVPYGDAEDNRAT